ASNAALPIAAGTTPSAISAAPEGAASDRSIRPIQIVRALRSTDSVSRAIWTALPECGVQCKFAQTIAHHRTCEMASTLPETAGDLPRPMVHLCTAERCAGKFGRPAMYDSPKRPVLTT